MATATLLRVDVLDNIIKNSPEYRYSFKLDITNYSDNQEDSYQIPSISSVVINATGFDVNNKFVSRHINAILGDVDIYTYMINFICDINVTHCHLRVTIPIDGSIDILTVDLRGLERVHVLLLTAPTIKYNIKTKMLTMITSVRMADGRTHFNETNFPWTETPTVYCLLFGTRGMKLAELMANRTFFNNSAGTMVNKIPNLELTNARRFRYFAELKMEYLCEYQGEQIPIRLITTPPVEIIAV